MQRAITIIAVVIFALNIESKAENPDQKYIDANQIVVKSVFFVPKNGPEPNIEDIKNLNRHIQWTRQRYREMLKGRDTFEISGGTTEIYHSEHPLAYYKNKPEDGAPWYLEELFEHFGYDRNTCPYVYVIVVSSETDEYLKGGGRNFNGGLDKGGGFALVSLHTLRNFPNFQSTIRHELGHAFGLVHVKAYGYDMGTNESIMSYNKKHHTDFFKDSDTPGILIPEDIRSLAKNNRVFQKLTFDKSKDIPKGYEMKKNVTLGAIVSPGERK